MVLEFTERHGLHRSPFQNYSVVPLCSQAFLSFSNNSLSSQILLSCTLLFSVSLSNLEFSCPFSLQTLKNWNLEIVVSL